MRAVAEGHEPVADFLGMMVGRLPVFVIRSLPPAVFARALSGCGVFGVGRHPPPRRLFGDMAGPEERMMLETLAEATPMAEWVPFASDLLADDPGYVWAQRHELPEGGASTEWRVFTETGGSVGTVVPPERFHAVGISADTIAGVFTDGPGRQDIRVHSLDRGADTAARPMPAGCS